VGMSGVFPGADTLEEYWDNLTRGVDSVTTIDRWKEKDYFEPDPGVPNKSYINRSGLVRGMKEFDPLFFNISPKEAEFMDPQQRLFLEAAWKALEDAGYNDKYLDERKCGVFVGCMEDYYERLIEESGAEKSNYIFNGITIPILSARISYFLNLRGPSIVVSTACSSALVAIHLACESIINKTSEIAIAGGVNVLATPMFHVLGSSTGMFSYTNEIRPFDNAADGFIPAEGCGAFVLKPLEKAKKDGDHIYGVIVGSGINQDGKSNGITAPSAPSQAALECEVYEKYKINPEHISYIEAHGTGTRLGDPIEIEALREAFSKFTDKKQFCAIGSVKSNIGHTLQAAGSASLAKVLLCMKNKKLVPSIHFQSENELIPFKDSPVYVNTEYKDWIPAEGAPRMAAISAFGISGTNCHVVVKEYDEEQQNITKEEPYYLIALSAKTKEQLAKRVTDLQEWLHKEKETHSLGNIANTLMIGRCHFSYRMALIVNSIQDLNMKLHLIRKQMQA
jgi:acyl transferase domain-containing protein